MCHHVRARVSQITHRQNLHSIGFFIRVSLTAIHNVTSVYIDPIDFLHSYSSKPELLDGREEEEGEGEEEQAPGKTAENLGVRLCGSATSLPRHGTFFSLAPSSFLLFNLPSRHVRNTRDSTTTDILQRSTIVPVKEAGIRSPTVQVRGLAKSHQVPQHLLPAPQQRTCKDPRKLAHDDDGRRFANADGRMTMILHCTRTLTLQLLSRR